MPAPTPSGPPPLSSADKARLPALAAKFAKACDVDALAELRRLRAEHGAVPELVGPLSAAFTSCAAPAALADLLVETLPENPTRTQQLQVGAALVRARRYGEAAERLEPLVTDGDPQTAWLAGFSLYHAGDRAAALPLLEAGQSKGTGSDPALLIGMSRLHLGDVEGALALLEAGVGADPNNPSLHHALTRAYAAADRPGDAAASAERARALHAARAETEAVQSRLSALGTALNAAWEAGRLDEAEQIIDSMWGDAPPKLRHQLLGFRVELYKRTGRPDEAAAAAAQRAAMESR